MDDLSPDRVPGALPCVTSGIRCPGCGHLFSPTHWRQKHCRPSCRVLALRTRREHAADLFTDAMPSGANPRRDPDP